MRFKSILQWTILLIFPIIILDISAGIIYKLSFNKTYSGQEILDKANNTILKTPTANTLNTNNSINHPYYGWVFNTNAYFKQDKKPTLDNLKMYHLGVSSSLAVRNNTEDHVRVAILGGSVANYFGGQKVIEATLKKFPEFKNKTIEVINFALPGYKQPQQLIILTDLIAQGMHFDLVISLDGFNEICIASQNYDINVFPLLPWGWGKSATHSSNTLKLLGIVELYNTSLDYISKAIVSTQLYRSAIFGLAFSLAFDTLANNRAFYEQQAMKSFSKTTDDSDVIRTNDTGTTYIGPNVHTTQEQFVALATRQWVRSMIIINNLTLQQGGRYVHFFQPSLVSWEKARGLQPSIISCVNCIEAAAPSFDKAALAAQKSGIDLTNLQHIFNESDTNPFIDCCHFNNSGAEILNHAIESSVYKSINSHTMKPVNLNEFDKQLAEIMGTANDSFSYDADLMESNIHSRITTYNLYNIEKSNNTPYRTAFGPHTEIHFTTTKKGTVTFSLALENTVPGQQLEIKLNDTPILINQELPYTAPFSIFTFTGEGETKLGDNVIKLSYKLWNIDGSIENMPPLYASKFVEFLIHVK